MARSKQAQAQTQAQLEARADLSQSELDRLDYINTDGTVILKPVAVTLSELNEATKIDHVPGTDLSNVAPIGVPLPFVPTVIPSLMVEDLFLVKMKGDRIFAVLSDGSEHAIASITNQSFDLHFSKLSKVLGKKAESLFRKTFLKYSSLELVTLGFLKPSQAMSFDRWQDQENRKIAERKALRDAQPKPMLTAQQMAEREEKRAIAKKERYEEMRAIAASLIISG